MLRGCYVDSAASRTLQGGVYQDWSGMTVQMCAEKASSYRYMGVEYYGLVSLIPRPPVGSALTEDVSQQGVLLWRHAPWHAGFRSL